MTTHFALQMASACVESLELRQMFSGEIDHSFGANGLVTVPSAGAGATLVAPNSYTAVQTDGKIVVVGQSKTNGNSAVVSRFLAGGTPDSSFGVNGVRTIANVNASRIDGISIVSNGAILVQGQTYFRLTSSGNLDTSFGGGDGVASSLIAGDRRVGRYTNAVLADGSYVELQSAANGHAVLVKYKADGSLDKSFGTGGFFNIATLSKEQVSGTLETGGVAVDSSGRIYVSYDFLDSGDFSNPVFLARLTAGGKLDSSYGDQGIARNADDGQVAGGPIASLPDGRVLVMQIEPSERKSAADLVVFSADGKSHSNLGFDLANNHVGITDFAVAKDGSVYIGGDGGVSYVDQDRHGYASVLHLTKALTLDTNFSADRDGVGGFRTSNGTNFSDLALTPGGNVILLGGDSNRAQLVQIDGPSRPTRVGFSHVGTKLIINGFGGVDQFKAITGTYREPDNEASFGGVLVVSLDSSPLLSSVDQILVNPRFTPAVQQLVFNLNSGDDRFDGSGLQQSVYVNGGAGKDYIIGGHANDSLYGGDGVDSLFGGGGTDKIVQ